jgi:uncharacterized phage protein (TIGR01671 family)
MRHISFRAWDKKEKEMIDLDSLEIYEDLDRRGFYTLGEVLNSEEWIVMQSTNLTDKDGKEIYEGDLVKKHGPYKGEIAIVEWQDPLWGDGDTGGSGYPLLEDDSHLYEVIGNVWQNQDLIK